MVQRHVLRMSLVLSCILPFGAPLLAQQVVHALTGTVTAVNPSDKTLTIHTDDGTAGVFTTVEKSGTELDFLKSVRATSTPAASFTKVDTRVLVYYIGDSDTRTAIALADLGSGPFVNTTGTITKLDRHTHTLTIKTDSGDPMSFHIDDKTIAEDANGVEEGLKFSADKGEKVRVVATKTAGGNQAHFIRALS